LPPASIPATAGATEVSVFIGDLAAAAVSVVEGRASPTAVIVLASRRKPVAVEVDVLTGPPIGAIRQILRQAGGPRAKEDKHYCRHSRYDQPPHEVLLSGSGNQLDS
jgi:hypothetical protein